MAAAAVVAITGTAWYANRTVPRPPGEVSQAPLVEPPAPPAAIPAQPQVERRPVQIPGDSTDAREAGRQAEEGEAQQAWEKFRGARDADPTAVEAFLQRYPNSSHAGAARILAAQSRNTEAAAWLAVKESTDAAALRSYAARFPWSEHIGEARSRISMLENENAAWILLRDTSDVEALQVFVRSFPNGTRHLEATARIGRIVADREAEKAATAARSRPPNQPAPVSSAPEPAVAAPQRPQSGRLIWQGVLPRSGAITIGGPSLTGTVLGALPRAPATWRAFPAEQGGGTITVYSDAPRPAEGRFVYAVDPKRAGQVKVTPRNDGTLDVHCADQRVKVIVLDWVAH